ncbi:AI-2E family transporter [Microbacterium stercoris]|uniref:AI-2E family transporter n=1 Tax=Microbacterium stercoris TaxID=2820289 RepID=A0A939QG61_9MICO|nr:AI-2E family transporter [Microbacterium stercoris]MBO3662344.1 AI-2E family transporter [Microbacterium stercoris]MBO3664336.1 AI-2E family transporter [Microbacterium stercoris]
MTAPVDPAPQRAAGLPAVALWLIAVFVVILGMRELAWLIAPAFLALVMVILVHPVYAGLAQRGAPRALALTAMILAAFGILAALVALVLYGLARLATILPAYGAAALASLTEVTDALAHLGIGTPQIRELLESVDIAALARWLTAQIPSLISVGTGLILFYSLLIFMGIESAQLTQRAAALDRDHPRLATSLVAFARNVRRYVAVTGVFAIIVGALDALFLWALDIPHPLLWGLLATACNFIPYVGFIIGLVPPALLALLDHGWPGMLLVIAVYVVLNSIITSLLPARFVGSAVGMSMTVTMASVIFWAWVLGPLGAVLAIPFSLLVKAVFIDGVPSAQWLAGFVDAAPRRARPARDPERGAP